MNYKILLFLKNKNKRVQTLFKKYFKQNSLDLLRNLYIQVIESKAFGLLHSDIIPISYNLYFNIHSQKPEYLSFSFKVNNFSAILFK